MSYEAWRISYQSSEQAARSAYQRAESLKSERDELQAQVKAMEWQPIQTAPNDEIVLLTGEMDGPGDWRIKCGYRDDTTRSGWKIWGASWEPSHWMPLPQPPKNGD